MSENRQNLEIEARINWTKELAVRVAKLKVAKGMRQKEFCSKYSLNLITFSRCLNLHTVPKKETLDRIENALVQEGV